MTARTGANRRAVPARPAPSAPAQAPRTSGAPADFLADALFRQLDINRDGVLTGTEIPSAFCGAVDERGAIDADTFADLFQSNVKKLRDDRSAGARPISGAGTAPRPGGVPAWFAALDPDGAGQVSLRSWRAAGRPVAEFQRMDTNGDGLVTRREAQAFFAQAQALASAGGTASDGAINGRSAAGFASGAAKSTSAAGATSTKPMSRADALLAHYGAIAAGRPAPKSRGTSALSGAATASAQPTATDPAAAPPAGPAPGPTGPPPIAALPLPLIDNDYWVTRNNENLAQLYGGAPSDVLFLGDSITDFFQNGDGATLWDEEYAPLGALDFGIAAIETSHVLWQIETGQVALAAPKVVVLLIGSNNLGNGQNPEDVATGIEKIVSELGVQLPQTRVLLLGLLPRGASPTDAFRGEIGKVNSLIADLDDGDRVTYRDIGASFLSADGSIAPEIMPDGAHPTLRGYHLYTNAVWPTLTDLMKEP